MKIALETTTLFTPRRNFRGIGRYQYELVRGLRERGVEVVLAVKAKRFFRAGAPGSLKGGSGVTWGGLLRFRRDLDLIHGAGAVLPEGKAPRVATLFDMIPFEGAEYLSPGHARRARARTGALIRSRPEAVIAISSHTKERLLHLFPDFPEERINVVHLGVRASPERERSALERHGLTPGRYLLFAGAPEPRKNLTLPIRALPCLKGLKLVVAGGELRGRERELVKTLGAGEQLVEAGAVGESTLSSLYGSAFAVILPSRLEGFGLPVLEAMAHSAPVVCSDIPVLREVGGNAALYVNPDDVEGFVAAVESLKEPSLRKDLVEKGVERAAGFTWEKCVDETLAVYRRAGVAAHVEPRKSGPTSVRSTHEREIDHRHDFWERSASRFRYDSPAIDTISA